jgi:hypothetical protein
MRVRTRAYHKELTVFLENSSNAFVIGALVQSMILRILEIDPLMIESSD